MSPSFPSPPVPAGFTTAPVPDHPDSTPYPEPPADVAQLRREHARLQAECRALRAENETLRSRLATGKAEQEPLKSALQESETRQHRLVEWVRQESEARFRNMADHAPTMIWVSDRQGRNVFVNRTWCTFTGITEHACLDFGWLEAVHPDDRDATRETFLRALDEQQPFQLDYRLRRHDGVYRWAIDAGAPHFGDDGTFLGYIGSVIDISDRKEAERALRDFNEHLERRVVERTTQVRALSLALTLAEQRERHRIATLLHDGIQQLLFGIRMKTMLCRHDAEREAPPLLQQLSDIEQLLDHAIDGVRTLSLELSPPVLTGEGLDTALRWLASHMERLYGFTVTVEVEPPCPIHHEAVRVLLLELVREILFNAVKHADVDRARVRLCADQKHTRICIEDEGRGFDVDALLNDPGGTEHLGLVSVRKRLELLGGRMEIHSSPGRGTRVTIVAPTGEAFFPDEDA